MAEPHFKLPINADAKRRRVADSPQGSTNARWMKFSSSCPRR